MSSRTIVVSVLLAAGAVFGWYTAPERFFDRASARDVKKAASAQPGATAQPAAAALDRTVLPIPEPKLAPITDARRPQRQGPAAVRGQGPGQGARTSLIVLIDDMGFGQSSAFGGPIHMPTLREAGEGRAAVQPVPHHGALLADPRRPADRPQPSRLQHGLDHRDRHRLPRPDRAAARTASPRWPRCCGSTATARPPSASRTRPPPGRSARPARPTAGRPAPASTSSTASSAARRTSGPRPSTRT